MTKVLFVCTANVCRSPMAEAILNAIAREKGLRCEARSAGVAALVGERISPRARAALEEVGIDASVHRARQVNAAMLEESDLALAMTGEHASTLRRLYGGHEGKIHTLTAFASGASLMEDIPDPYGQSMFMHRASVHQLLHHLDALVGRIQSGRSPSSS